ncbi:MAG: hypothetical protein COY66_06250 [Candidatus Kerfeldbacteria bacterium CG_4_10_14_0_8_um_filter_42_10]|uniref:Polymerase nucleotidyl transferase domain-containing protein n=1 Tax=Candidatus Kerfeldbacteria bacterium CG_4_10_14_0_8_um_filter_42_10 TaxID=2014248 RepID=A0A2M7RGD6_9BACT|nr:MAG: hypothetical protein COY66_06250 [Candidatus Kerfeldbacteria bacterium CG_4_10_14_0_8_um_filter_42_10]
MEHQSLLEKSILTTICYFDIFDYPLTLVEIWKWLFMKDWNPQEKVDLTALHKILDQSAYLKKNIDSRSGFYFLKGRQKTVEIRKERYNIAEVKFRKAQKIIRLLRLIPFVKMIAICNTLAISNSRRRADIDLFIITKHNRVWQTRFWTTGFLKLFGLRPLPNKTQDTFCASFFIDENNLNLNKIAIKDDVYLPYWISQVYPIYDEGIYKKFVQENQWVRDELQNSLFVRPTARRKVNAVPLIKQVLSPFCRLLPEQIFKHFQLKIMPARLKALANKDSRVIIQDHMLKFHDIDRRDEFKKLFYQKLADTSNE